MHHTRIRDTFVIEISKHVDIYDNLICVTEAVGLCIILVNCRPFATLVQLNLELATLYLGLLTQPAMT